MTPMKHLVIRHSHRTGAALSVMPGLLDSFEHAQEVSDRLDRIQPRWWHGAADAPVDEPEGETIRRLNRS